MHPRTDPTGADALLSRHGQAFFSEAPPAERAGAVTLPGFDPLTRWRGNSDELAAALQSVETMEPSDLVQRLVRQRPPLVGVPLPGGGMVVTPVDHTRVSAFAPVPAR